MTSLEIMKLMQGPAKAILISFLGSAISLSLKATPPNAKSTILSNFIPYFLAMVEWPSSCNSIENKAMNPPVRPNII